MRDGLPSAARPAGAGHNSFAQCRGCQRRRGLAREYRLAPAPPSCISPPGRPKGEHRRAQPAEPPSRLPFFTVGHSTRSLDAFVALLEAEQVTLRADIRTIPRSRTNPQFNADTLAAALAARQIGYEHIGALGGLRARSKTVARTLNGYWTNDSFHNYADYALSPEFGAALDALVGQGRSRRCVLMCAEAVWWRCHRRIVADHLIARGEAVFHIMAPGHVEPARLTPGAVVRPDGTVVYPLPA